MLNAALSRLEAAIGAAQSQEARVAYLAKQASAAEQLVLLLRSCAFRVESVQRLQSFLRCCLLLVGHYCQAEGCLAWLCIANGDCLSCME